MGPGRRAGIAFLVLALSIPLVACTGVDFYSPSTIMHESLPLVLKAFGPHARLQTLTLDDVEADYAVITSDGTLHRRSYHCGIQNCPGGLRATQDTPATRLQRSAALIPLGLLNTTVPDRLLSKLGISGGAAQLMLEGGTWTILDSRRILYHWQARYDGAGLHTSQTPADIRGAGVSPKAPAVTSTARNSTQTTGTSTTQRLLACVKAARQNVTKLLVCQERFGP